MDLYARVKSRPVMHGAWAKVRQSGYSSDSEQTVRDTRQFDHRFLAGLDALTKKLRNNAFEFSGERGITPPKAKGSNRVRPIVISPIPNRIVRRAILDVLQGYGAEDAPARSRWPGLPAIKNIMATPTSIGGVAERGVPYGLAIIEYAVNAGNHWFARSDIQSFFTRIPKGDVSAFVRAAANDDRFSDLFDQALATNLENQSELEERRRFTLFPNSEIGVAQGSALSALAGNITLRKFDQMMNDRGITCIRYIDDFMLLGPTQAKVAAAYHSARAFLQKLGMDIYDLGDVAARRDGKADVGKIFDGTDFLGYRISRQARQPCAAAIATFRGKLDKAIVDTERAMKAAINGDTSLRAMTYHASMAALHKMVWGWSQAFKYTNVPHVFRQLDADVDKSIDEIDRIAAGLVPRGDRTAERRIRGIHPLVDTPTAPIQPLVVQYEQILTLDARLRPVTPTISTALPSKKRPSHRVKPTP